MTVRFIHSADWQLGMTRHFLEGEAQSRFAQDRIDAIGRIGDLAREHGAEFVVVAGDVFETNQVSRQTVVRACGALARITVPVFLLPGNHEQLDATSVFRQPTFLREVPANVVVIDTTQPYRIDGRPGLEIVGAPRTTKRSLGDPLEPGYRALEPRPGVTRVLVGHGIVDVVMPIGDAPDEETRIRVAPLEAALADGRVAYVALGDRHSATRVGGTGRIWYSGAPEPTAYVETDAGFALLVEIDETGAGTPAAAAAPCTVTRLPVATWRFVLGEHHLAGPADVDALARWFAALPSPERTIVKVTLVGTLALRDKARLDELLATERDRFAAVEEWERHTDLSVVPDDADFADLDLSGYAAGAARRPPRDRRRGGRRGGGRERGARRPRAARREGRMSGPLRIARILVVDFRGIAEREVRFAPEGVTVIEGPNESGKSSLPDALDLLLEYRDSSRHRDVLGAQPVGKDVGPLVEADLVIGPFDLTYRKRWVRDRETALIVRSPRPERLSGDEAHDRVRDLLASHADLGLWRALRLMQGEKVGQASVEATGSLGAALERAAGGIDPAEEGSLFTRVEAEAALYFTATGREKDPVFGPLEGAVARADEAATRIRAQLAAIEADATALERATAELAGMHETLAAQEVATREREARRVEVERLAGAARERRADHEAAAAKASEARRAAEGRRALVTDRAAAIAERDRLVAAAADLGDRQGTLDAALASAVDRADRARTGRESAARVLAARRADRDGLRDRAELAALEERKARLDALTEEGRAAQAAVETNPVTDPVLRAIEDAFQAVALARARLDGGAGDVSISAISAFDAVVDGAIVPMTPGSTKSRPIGDGIEIEVPGVVRVTARPGASAGGLRDAHGAAEAAVTAALAAAGTADLAEARARNADLRVAAETVRRTREAFLAVLAGERPAELEQRIVTLAARAVERAAAGDARPAGLSVPADDDEAAALLEVAEAADRTAATELGIAEEAERAARAAADTERTASEERRVALGIAEGRVRDLDAALAAARAEAADDVLDGRSAAADREAADAGAARAAADAALAEANPEQAEMLAENARKALQGMRDRQQDLSREQARFLGSLAGRGEDGLGERLDLAEGELERARDALARLRRRAAAAKLLHDTMRRRRDDARRRYVLPLKQRLEGLGRVVFASDVTVDLREDLSIASLTRGGIPIAWEQLSVGTREQLGVLVRLACAELVAPDGGVPVMLDDALGWSDPGRLEAMGAVLARAGESSQVIVLTCFPDRYVHVGGATVLRVG